MSARNKMRYKSEMAVMIFAALSIISVVKLHAQDNGKTDNGNSMLERIQWISQFPPAEEDRKKSNLLEWISELIVGEKPTFINKPISILAFDPNNFWVIDQGYGMIVHVRGRSAKNIRFGKKNNPNFSSLVDLCELSGNELLVTESRLNQIYRIDLRKPRLIPLNDSLLLNRPTGIAYSEINNEIWVIETQAHHISILNNHGELIKTIGVRGEAPGEFNFPTHIWIDKSGHAYIVDSMNFRVQIFNRNGELESIFGEQGDATGYFGRPKGIATDTHGNIYVADALFHVIQIFDKEGRFLFWFGSQGREKEQFWMPSGIFIDSENYIYVTDMYNSRIQVFKLVN